MNLTIPIRAESSTSSWSHGLRGSSSNNYLAKNKRGIRKRHILSMMGILFFVSALVLGSVGGVMQVASAKSNFNNTSNSNNFNSNSRRDTTSNSTPPKTTTTTKTQTTPRATKTTTPTPTPAKSATTTPPATTPTPAATLTPAPAVTQTAPKVVAPPPAPKPVDTAPAINNMTAAQADKSVQPVTYTSNQISDQTRNHILIVAGVVAVTGGLLYTMSLFVGAAPAKRTIPIRYILPVKEVITN